MCITSLIVPLIVPSTTENFLSPNFPLPLPSLVRLMNEPGMLLVLAGVHWCCFVRPTLHPRHRIHVHRVLFFVPVISLLRITCIPSRSRQKFTFGRKTRMQHRGWPKRTREHTQRIEATHEHKDTTQGHHARNNTGSLNTTSPHKDRLLPMGGKLEMRRKEELRATTERYKGNERQSTGSSEKEPEGHSVTFTQQEKHVRYRSHCSFPC